MARHLSRRPPGRARWDKIYRRDLWAIRARFPQWSDEAVRWGRGRALAGLGKRRKQTTRQAIIDYLLGEEKAPPPPPPPPPPAAELPLMVTPATAFHVYNREEHPDNVELARKNLAAFYSKYPAGVVSASVDVTVYGKSGDERVILAEESTDIGVDASPSFDEFVKYYYAAVRQWLAVMKEEGVYSDTNYESLSLMVTMIVIYPPTA